MMIVLLHRFICQLIWWHNSARRPSLYLVVIESYHSAGYLHYTLYLLNYRLIYF